MSKINIFEDGKNQKDLEQKLKSSNFHSSQLVELSDEEIVKIIGGAYMKAVEETQAQKEDVCTCPEKCCGEHKPTRFYSYGQYTVKP